MIKSTANLNGKGPPTRAKSMRHVSQVISTLEVKQKMETGKGSTTTKFVSDWRGGTA